MTFWLIIIGIAVAVATVLLQAIQKGDVGDVPPASYDLQVYKDQLSEIGRDLARGVISSEDAERTRVEVSRRILAADSEIQKSTGPAGTRQINSALMGALGFVVIGGSVALYDQMGAHNGTGGAIYGDLPLKTRIAMAKERAENRPSQQEAEQAQPATINPDASPEYTALMDRLRTAVAERPDDLQGHQLLARNEFALGNFQAAYAAQERILTLKSDEASAADYAQYANSLIYAAGGYVSPKAERALRGALARNPMEGTALYFSGLMMMQTGRPDVAFRIWDKQLRDGPDDAPWLPPIRSQIEEAAALAGVDYTPPTALRGPTSDDIAAAGDMSAEDRQQMIQSMVDGLSDRLATQGGSAAEWARLIGALGVLGETERAAAIYQEAQRVFAEYPNDMAAVREAAERAGLK